EFPNMPSYRNELASGYSNLGILLNDLEKRPEAEAAHRHAFQLREKLVTDFPNAARYRLDLAGSYVNLGHLIRDGKRAEDSLTWFSKAITLLEPLVGQQGPATIHRKFLRNAHWGRAVALQQLARPADAVRD